MGFPDVFRIGNDILVLGIAELLATLICFLEPYRNWSKLATSKVCDIQLA